MPDVTALATTLRQGGFQYTGYLVTPPRTIVLEGTITATATYPALQVTYTTTAGSSSNVTQDMTVVFTSSTGVLKAVLRVASGQSITSTVLPINEFSRSLYEVTIGDKLKVYQEYRIWDRLVSATSELRKDSRIAYTDQLANPVPVCNSGGPYAGFGTTVSFEGDLSFTTDPDSSGSMTHAWDFVDGTPSTSSSANPSNIVFPVGFREVKHTATDASNGKSTIQYVEVYVCDKTTYPPLRVQMDNLNDPRENATRISFKLPYGSEGDIATLPDGAPIVYFERETRKGVEGSYGSNIANRSHVKFSGYLVRDSISIDAQSNEVTFEAVNALGILEDTPALPQLNVSTATPTKWSEVRGLSTKEILWYLSYWGATNQTSWDFAWTDGLDLDYARVAVQGQTIAEQLRDIANSINVMVTCDALGRIQFIRDPDFLDLDERAARTISYNFTTADMIKIDWTREHRGTTKFVRGEGITPTNQPVFSNAPGAAPASLGTGSETLTKQIVANQNDCNKRTVRKWAQLNGLYKGRFVPKDVRMTVPDGYDVIQCGNGEYVTLALPANTNTRGISFEDTELWTVASKDITYDNKLGAKSIVYTLNHETYMAHSNENTYIPPQQPDNGLPSTPPIVIDFPSTGTIPGTNIGVSPVPPPGSPTSPSTANMAAFADDNTASFTGDFTTPESGGGPDWTTTAPLDLTGLSGWGGGTLITFAVDDYSPSYLGTGDEVNGVILTDECLQRIEDIFGTPTLGTANVFADASEMATLTMDRSAEGFGIAARYVPGDGVYAVVTDDGGATWAETLVTAFENTSAGGIAPGVWIDPHTAGRAYIAVWTATGDNTDAEASLYKTTNSGASWSHLTSPDIDSGVDVSSIIGVSFDNAPGNRIYHRRKDGDGLHLIRNANGTETDITPEPDVLYVPTGQFLHEIALPDDDENALAMIGATGFSATTWSVVFKGTELGRGVDGFGQPYIDVEAELWPDGGGYYIFLATAGDDICCTLSDVQIQSGSQDLGGSGWALCGEALFELNDPPPHTSGFINSAIGHSIRELRLGSTSPITYRVTFDTDCLDEAAITYALLKSGNALATEPTWTVVDSGNEDTFPYKEVIALGSGKYLVYGVNGSIGYCNGSSIDSRKGDIASTGRICGTAGR